jgi:hypothetical protein
MIAWGRKLISFIWNAMFSNDYMRNGNDLDSPLVRLLQVEYNRDYKWFKANHIPLTDDHVSAFLASIHR